MNLANQIKELQEQNQKLQDSKKTNLALTKGVQERTETKKASIEKYDDSSDGESEEQIEEVKEDSPEEKKIDNDQLETQNFLKAINESNEKTKQENEELKNTNKRLEEEILEIKKALESQQKDNNEL